MLNSETSAAKRHLTRGNEMSATFANSAVHALRQAQIEGVSDLPGGATKRLADAMRAYCNRHRPKDEDLFFELLTVALERVDWLPIARMFVEDAWEAERSCFEDFARAETIRREPLRVKAAAPQPAVHP